jgi:hypothetical protein
MSIRFAAGLALAVCCACGGDTPPPPNTPSGPPPDFSVSCQPAGFGAGAGCGTSACSVTSLNGFTGAVTLSCSGAPDGLACGFGPNPVTLAANGTTRTGFTVAAGPTVPDRVHAFEVAAVSGGTRRTARVTVETVFVAPPPPVSSRSFMVSGCSGYVDGVLGNGTLQLFVNNFTVARKKGLTGPGCAQALGAPNGRFDLEVPRGCFAEGEEFDLLAGGVPSCTTRRFTGGANEWAVVLGRRTACP